jgi:hypothetical protein
LCKQTNSDHLSQYYDSLERPSTYKAGGLEEEMRAVTIKALEKFWSITQMPMDEDNKTIVARSFAYIGHILTKRESLVQSGEQTFELSKNPEFSLYLHNPQEALTKAFSLSSGHLYMGKDVLKSHNID